MFQKGGNSGVLSLTAQSTRRNYQNFGNCGYASPSLDVTSARTPSPLLPTSPAEYLQIHGCHGNALPPPLLSGPPAASGKACGDDCRLRPTAAWTDPSYPAKDSSDTGELLLLVLTATATGRLQGTRLCSLAVCLPRASFEAPGALGSRCGSGEEHASCDASASPSPHFTPPQPKGKVAGKTDSRDARPKGTLSYVPAGAQTVAASCLLSLPLDPPPAVFSQCQT